MEYEIKQSMAFNKQKKCECPEMQEMFLNMMKKPERARGDAMLIFCVRNIVMYLDRHHKAVAIWQKFFNKNNFGEILLNAQEHHRECRGNAGN